MLQKYFIALGLIIASITAPPTDADGADWWGRKLPDTPTQFVFGYGSLINTASRNSMASARIGTSASLPKSMSLPSIP